MKMRIMGHVLSTFSFFAICIGVSFFLIFLFILFAALILTSDSADIEFGKFFEIVLKDLPKNDFDSLVVNGLLFKGYRRSYKSAYDIMVRIVAHGEKNFSKEGQEILKRTVPIYVEMSEHWKCQKPLSIKNALQMGGSQILKRYIIFGSEHKIREENKQNRVYNLLTLIFCVPSICFIVWPGKSLLVISNISLIFEIFISKLFAKKSIPFSKGSSLLTWFLTFLTTVSSPLFLSKRNFLAPAHSIWFYFPLISIVLHTVIGMWLTHQIILPTKVEKGNIGRYVADHKLLDIIDSKIMPVIRTLWIWMSFFIVIFGTIFMYSVIFYKQLSLGSYFKCLFLSTSTYFRDGNFVLETIEGKYFLTEAVASFFINTLYIAYIIQFTFTSQKRK